MNNKLKKVFIFLFICMIGCVGYAQKVKKVKATITYVVPENQSIADAVNIVIEQAKLKAIADEFGTMIEQTNLTQIDTRNGESNMELHSYNESQVKGEWIETIKQKVERGFENEMITLTCKIEGRARERKASTTMLEVKVLRNAPEKQFESDTFKDGDQLFLEFKSPADGYIAIYLIDSDKEATCLLPYPADPDGQMEVKHGQEYIFFSRAHDPNAPKENDFIKRPSIVKKYFLECEDNHELNRLYIIFSTNPFIKAVDTIENGVAHLSENGFHKWLSHTRAQDPELVVMEKNIYVNK